MLILLLLISFSAQAQVNKAPLFRISTAHGDSYLLGTIHIGVSLKEFNVDVVQLINQSRIFLLELDLTDEQLELLQP